MNTSQKENPTLCRARSVTELRRLILDTSKTSTFSPEEQKLRGTIFDRIIESDGDVGLIKHGIAEMFAGIRSADLSQDARLVADLFRGWFTIYPELYGIEAISLGISFTLPEHRIPATEGTMIGLVEVLNETYGYDDEFNHESNIRREERLLGMLLYVLTAQGAAKKGSVFVSSAGSGRFVQGIKRFVFPIWGAGERMIARMDMLRLFMFHAGQVLENEGYNLSPYAQSEDPSHREVLPVFVSEVTDKYAIHAPLSQKLEMWSERRKRNDISVLEKRYKRINLSLSFSS